MTGEFLPGEENRLADLLSGRFVDDPGRAQRGPRWSKETPCDHADDMPGDYGYDMPGWAEVAICRLCQELSSHAWHWFPGCTCAAAGVGTDHASHCSIHRAEFRYRKSLIQED